MISPIRILWLSDITSDISRSLVGGKALELIKLKNSGFNVPLGFVITTQVFSEIVGNSSDYSNLQKLHDQISQTSFPIVIINEIDKAVKRLMSSGHLSNGVMVRSSAVFEDNKDFSAAGQLESYACRLTLDEVITAVKKVWISLFSENLLYYYKHSGSKEQLQIAVIVQELVPADTAGVLFTTHIADYTQIEIESSWGLGISVVSGKVTPDRFLVNRDTLDIVSADISTHKNVGLQFDDDLGIYSVDMGDKARIQSLANQQIKDLALMAKGIENLYKIPVDIEWAFCSEILYLLQVRPITVLPVEEQSIFTTESTEQTTLWTSGFFEERFTSAVSPLMWSFVFPAIERTALVEPLHFVGAVPVLQRTRLYKGRVYTNVTLFQKMYKFFPSIFMPDDAKRFFPSGNIEMRKHTKDPSLVSLLGSVTRTIFSEPSWHPFNYLMWNRFVKRLQIQLTTQDEALKKSTSYEEVLKTLEASLNLTVAFLRIHRWSIIYAEIISSLLRKTLSSWTTLSLESIQTYLVTEHESPSKRTDKRLELIAKRAIELGVDYGQMDYDSTSMPLELRKLIEQFLLDFGHRSFRLDILSPRYADDPQEVCNIVLQLMKNSRFLEEINQRSILRDKISKQLATELKNNSLNRIIPFKAVFVYVLLEFAKKYFALREYQRFEWQKILYLTRRAFNTMEEKMISENLLSKSGDIFFLTWDEINKKLKRQNDTITSTVIEARCREFKSIQYADTPRFIKGNKPQLSDTRYDTVKNFKGIDASAGQAIGRARIIINVERLSDLLERLSQDDILVTKATDPGWTPIFGTIRGLVMTTGGRLSHGAIVAREYGIPAVVAVEGLIEAIKDGDTIMVDGDNGKVAILKDNQDPG